MISRRRNQTGMTGSMQMVDSREVQKSMDEYLEKDNAKNRGERKRLGEKFYRQWWGCLETCCGSCGTVYRLPRIKDSTEKLESTIDDINAFMSNTRTNKCPCCAEPIHDLMPRDPKIYFERREMEVAGINVLKINATEPLAPPKPKVDIEE
jgi:hypothetical protein